MSNIQNIDISLQEIVKNISKDRYSIPKFQRDFVWGTKDIVDLGDSIIRGYPISSLLIMPANGTLKIGSHSLLIDSLNNFDADNKYESENESKHYILDGQQRMVSIAKLFLSNDNKNEYYFDLLTILIDQYPKDNIEKDSGLWSSENKNHSPIGDSFCKVFPIGNDKSEKATRQNNRFISGKSIIENRFGSVVSKFLRASKNSSEENIDKYTDYLNGILGAISGYSVPATVIASDSELGVVIRVFEKVNSTGKKLTIFDLINAKSFQSKNKLYQGGLSNYITKEIIKTIDGKNILKPGVDNFLKFDDDKGFFEKLDRIIRIFEISNLLENNSVPSLFQSNMLLREPDFWFITWDKKGEKLLEIIHWMEDEGLINIGQITFLEYAAAIFLANQRAFEYEKFKNEIKKYTFYLILTESNFNKSNLDTIERIYGISKQITGNHESIRYEFESPSKNPNLTKSKILEYTTSKSGFKAIINIFYNNRPEGNFTVDITGNLIKKLDRKKMDEHHIYPKSRIKDFTKTNKFNSIANIVLVDKIANREEIKDKNPKEYFNIILSKNKGQYFCNQNLINEEEILKVESEDDALKFIENRAQKIAEIINAYFM